MDIQRNEENYKTFMLPSFNDENYKINAGAESFIKSREESIQLSKLLEQMHENEERLIFNQLIITIVLELLAILLFIAIFFLNDNIFEAKLKVRDEHMNLRLMFSMRSFFLKQEDKSWIINNYICVWRDDCIKFDFEAVNHDFGVGLQDIKHISIAGFSVRAIFIMKVMGILLIILVLSTIICSILIRLYRRNITIYQSEKVYILNIAQIGFYFIAPLFYLLFNNVFFGENYQIRWGTVLYLVPICLSSLSYFILKRNITSIIRVKSRII